MYAGAFYNPSLWGERTIKNLVLETHAGAVRLLLALAFVATLLFIGYSLSPDSGSAQETSGEEVTATPTIAAKNPIAEFLMSWMESEATATPDAPEGEGSEGNAVPKCTIDGIPCHCHDYPESCCGAYPQLCPWLNTATPTVQPTNTATPTVQPTSTPTPIPPASGSTATPTVESGRTPPPTSTSIPGRRRTSTPTPAPAHTATPTQTATHTPTPTPTHTPTPIPGGVTLSARSVVEGTKLYYYLNLSALDSDDDWISLVYRPADDDYAPDGCGDIYATTGEHGNPGLRSHNGSSRVRLPVPGGGPVGTYEVQMAIMVDGKFAVFESPTFSITERPTDTPTPIPPTPTNTPTATRTPRPPTATPTATATHTATPTPTSEPSDNEQFPTISITDSLTGVNSVLVTWSVDWGTATNKELTVEWEDTAQSVSNSESLSSSATKYEVTGLKSDTEYEFTITLAYRVSGRDGDKDSSRTVTTHSAPRLFVDQIDSLGVRSSNLLLTDFEWGVFLFVGSELDDLDSDTGSYQFAIDVPLSTGLEVAANRVTWCTWPESEPDELTWHDARYQVFFHVVKCGRGDGTTRMNIKARKLINGQWEEITYYIVKIGKAWHQQDDTVKYKLGGALPTPTATPAGYTGPPGPSPLATVGPLPSKVPVAVATAVAAWNDATSDGAPTGVSFCEGSGCRNTDGFTVTINTRDWYGECGVSGVACVRHLGTTAYPYIRNQTLTIEYPPATSQTKSEEWTNDYSDIVMDDDEYEYLPIVVAHELGHTAGLVHDLSPDRGTMRAQDIGDIETLLQDRDKKGMRELYGAYTADQE